MADDSINLTTSTKDEEFEPNSWINIFRGMLIVPIKTLTALSTSEISDKTSVLLGGALIVVLSALSMAAPDAYSSSINGILLKLLGSIFSNLFFWTILAIYCRALAALLRVDTSIRYCFVVTGWAFAPLIFKSVAGCFSNATVFGDIISGCLSCWFLVLELFAFDAVLKLGRFKTLGILLILPPCLFVTYFISMMFAGIMLSNGLY